MKINYTICKAFFKHCIAVLFLLSCNAFSYSQGTIIGEQRIWHTTTLLFNGPNTSEDNSYNPFLNYRLNVAFTAPSGKVLVVPGYYAADGNASESSATSGNKWAVHFTPDEIGTWDYKVSFRTGIEVAVSLEPLEGFSTSFDGISGNFNILDNNKSLPDNRAKGRLNYVGERYLKFEGSDRYFIKVGADSPENLLAHKDFDNSVTNKDWSPHLIDWVAGDPVWKGNKGKGLIGAVNYLASKGMNAFAFNMFNLDDPNTNNDGGDKTIWPWSSTDIQLLEGSSASSIDSRMRYDVSKLAQWEILFSHGDQRGMFLHFKTQERGNLKLLDGGNLGTQRKLYYREIIARFGHHLALNWNLGEEFHIYDPNLVNTLAAYIKAVDPYDHLIVLHTFPGQQERSYRPLLGTTSGLTGISIQMDITLVHAEVKKWTEESKNSGQPWVISNDEQGHWKIGVTVDEDFIGNHGSRPDNREAVRHRVLWGTLMAGGSGVEYYFGTETGETDWASENWRSRATKWEDAKIALDFFETHLNYWEMYSNDDLSNNTTDYCLADLANTYVIYLPGGSSTALDLSNTSGKYAIKWYDPRSGGALQNGSVLTLTAGGLRNIGLPPGNINVDWVALIRKEQNSTIDVKGITISPPTLELNESEVHYLNAQLIPSNATNKKIIWSSDNPNVAIVDEHGKVTAQAAGNATITATTVDGNFTASSAIKVKSEVAPNSIVNFTLVNAENNTDLLELSDNQIINLNEYQNTKFNIRANPNSDAVNSVVLNLSGPLSKNAVEHFPPFTLFGDTNGLYNGEVLAEGTYYLTAVTYDEPYYSGLQGGERKTITFFVTTALAEDFNEAPLAIAQASLVEGDAPLYVNFNGSNSSDDKGIIYYEWDFGDGNTSAIANPSHTFEAFGNFYVTLTVKDVSGLTHSDSLLISVIDPWQNEGPLFTMIDSNSDSDMFHIENEMCINSDLFLNKQVNIRANLKASNINSVSFSLKGPIKWGWTEHFAPYTLFGDTFGDYHGKELLPGNYVLDVSAFDGNQLKGTLLETASIQFTIADPSMATDDSFNVIARNDILTLPLPILTKSSIKLHPNPAVDYVHAKIINASATLTQIYVYNIAGSLVYSCTETKKIRMEDDSYKIDTSELPSGIYLIKVYTDSFTVFHYKLVVQ